MTSTPAAAAVAAPGPDPADPRRRLADFLAKTCGDEGGRLAARLLPASSSEPPRRHGGFYWLLFPEWLAENSGLTGRREGRRLVADLLWIQYCVWGVFRSQDDLVDGASGDALVAVQANHLLVEAARCAARHFGGGSPFWTIFQEAIDATARAIVRLDRLQRSPDRAPRLELALYADLSACLKIATAGVMLAADRAREWRQSASPALDRLAVAAQILDDLRDVGDDLRDGRINYAAWYLSHPIFSPLPEAIEAVVASNLALGGRLDELLAAVGGEVERAIDGLATASCPRMVAYLRDYRWGLDGLADRLRRSCKATVAAPGARRQPAPATANATASFSHRSTTADSSMTNSRFSTCSASCGATVTRRASSPAS